MLAGSSDATDFIRKHTSTLLGMAAIMKHVIEAKNDMDENYTFQLIDEHGIYNVTGMDTFMKDVKLHKCGFSYIVVSIMGHLCSGKSTILNHLFKTNFRVMDIHKCGFQTTKGIWLARCVDIDPFTIVLDLEGSSGRGLGMDNTIFAKQSALFALAVSDIVLINLWSHTIKRQYDRYIPLFESVFQAMVWMFSPRKITLLFVLRDKNRMSLEKLKTALMEDIHEIWDSIIKPDKFKDTPLSEFFNVEVVALSSLEEEEQFNEQVASLREKVFHSIVARGLVGDRHGVVPASEFSSNAQQIWKVIKEYNNFDICTDTSIATIHCENIVNAKIVSFINNEEWRDIEEAVQNDIVIDFGKKLNSILDNCMTSYDIETEFLDDNVRTLKWQKLKSKLLQIVSTAHRSFLKHLSFRICEEFKLTLDKNIERGIEFVVAVHDCNESLMLKFDEGCKAAVIKLANWDSSNVREKVLHENKAYVTSVRTKLLSKLTSLHEETLKKALLDPVGAFLDSATDDTWLSIRKLLQYHTMIVVQKFSHALSSFDIKQRTKEKMLAKIEEYGRSVVESQARVKAGRVLVHMVNRFSTLFNYDSNSNLRIWTANEDINAITKIARTASVKILSTMAAIRLDGDMDTIDNTLLHALVDTPSSCTLNWSSQSSNSLAASTWENVPAARTLITPSDCMFLWGLFQDRTDCIVIRARNAQANLNSTLLEAHWINNWLPSSRKLIECLTLLRRPETYSSKHHKDL